LKEKVQSNPELNEKYGSIWSDIDDVISGTLQIQDEFSVLSYDSYDSPEYFTIASQLIPIANEYSYSINDTNSGYTEGDLKESVDLLIPDEFDYEMNNELLKEKIDLLYEKFGDAEFLLEFTGGKKGDEAVEYILSRTIINSEEKMLELVKAGPDSLMNYGDPFINYVTYVDEQQEIYSKTLDELNAKEKTANQKLGEALFAVYGTSIPPDATFTLRISDGIVKGFDYNGTVAPPITTFYGMLDRHYSFNGEFPWDLDERWLDAPEEFDFATPFNFVSTNDVVGGNSGSPIINKSAEIVGVSFDGNIQSLAGDFIYDPEVNRSVGVHSAGMLEAIKDLYEFERLAEELENGKIED
jgi:hypothetical protein